MKIPLLLLSFLLAALSLSAQVNPQCPTVSVEGPAGGPRPGELISFTATVKPTESKLTYKWTIDRGTIVEGQGTPIVKVRFAGRVSGWLASVEIGGLPSECPNTASESTSIDYAPDPTKLDTFSLPLSSIRDDRFESIGSAISNNPTSQLLAFVPALPSVRDAFLERLNKAIRGDLDPDRVTFVESQKQTNLIEVWLVPPGATPPKCEECELSRKDSTAQDCPSLTVRGPTEVAHPSDLISFRLDSTTLSQNVQLFWTVSAGTIESGQGSREINVRVPFDRIAEIIKAVLNVSGLAKECVNTAEGIAAVKIIPIADPLFYYTTKLIEEKYWMQQAAFWLKNSNGEKLLIVKSFPKLGHAQQQRIKVLADFLRNFCGLRRNQFEFVSRVRPDTQTMIAIVRKDFVFKP